MRKSLKVSNLRICFLKIFPKKEEVGRYENTKFYRVAVQLDGGKRDFRNNWYAQKTSFYNG
jgi:hypothetical protein